jgi:uncharacterized membrane protein
MVQVGDNYFIQRLYIGIEPEEQTSREMKDRYGVFAYGISAYERGKNLTEYDYRITVDDEVIEMPGMKCYIINSGRMGTGLSVVGDNFAVDDGLLDVFVMNTHNMESMIAATQRFFSLDTEKSKRYIWRGKQITIETTPDKPVWTDGEYLGRTPITATVLPGILKIAVAPPQVFAANEYDAVLLVYEGNKKADEVYEALLAQEKTGDIKLHNAAVIHRGRRGKLRMQHRRGASTAKGLAGGGALGVVLLAATGGAALGLAAVAAGAGALLGSRRSGLEKEIKPLLEEKLGENDSALALIVASANWSKVRETLQPFGGQVLVTRLLPQTEEQLQAIDQDETIALALQADAEQEDSQ